MHYECKCKSDQHVCRNAWSHLVLLQPFNGFVRWRRCYLGNRPEQGLIKVCASIVEVKGSEIVAADCCNYNLQGMWLINALFSLVWKKKKKKRSISDDYCYLKKKKKKLSDAGTLFSLDDIRSFYQRCSLSCI